MDFAAGDPAERRGEPARAGEGEREPGGVVCRYGEPARAGEGSRGPPLKLEANTVPLTRKELRVCGTSSSRTSESAFDNSGLARSHPQTAGTPRAWCSWRASNCANLLDWRGALF